MRGFSRYVEDRAWERQGGLCARCGKPLVYYNRGQGGSGAYAPHHLRARVYGGPDSVRNCVLLCTIGENCHLHTGHGGDLSRRVVLQDGDLPFLYAGLEQPSPAR